MKKGKVSKKELKKKEEILSEIAESLKSGKDESEEETTLPESGLEEDVELNLKDLEFQQFMQPSETEEGKAPVLERIAGSQPGPIFVGGIPQGPGATPSEAEGGDDFKYIPGRNTGNEPKYIGSDSHISAETRRVDVIDAGRRHEIIPEVNQQAFFERASETRQRGFESAGVERFERAERFDTSRAGRKEPFEREEVKYEKYKPKLPKSY